MDDFDKTFQLVLQRFKEHKPKGYSDEDIFKAVDKAVNTIHNEEVQAVLIKSRDGESTYCNQCGHCCRTYGIVLLLEDIYKLSKSVEIAGNIIHEGNTYRFKDKPCKYLQSSGKCGCYHSRPQTCKNHPLTDPEQPRILRDPNCEYVLHLFTDIAFSMLTGQPFGGK